MTRRALTALLGVLGLAAVIAGLLWPVFGTRDDATIYAPGFSESKFRQVRKGMSKEEVLRLLGKPLQNDAHEPVQGMMSSNRRWFYSFLDRSKIPDDDRVTNTWFEWREIVFDSKGRVVEITETTEHFE